MSKKSLLWAVMATSTLLAGCSQESAIAKLHAFVQAGRSGTAKIKPLPATPPYQASAYQSGKNPFVSFSALAWEKEAAAHQGSPLPARKGPLLPLEKYPLGELSLSGILYAQGLYWGVFLTPSGKVYQARIGDPIGNQDGAITAIDAVKKTVTVVQYVANPFGGYKPQTVTMHFTEQAEGTPNE